MFIHQGVYESELERTGSVYMHRDEPPHRLHTLTVVHADPVLVILFFPGVYESELERTGNVYMLRDEPPHRLHTLTVQSIMATGVVGFKSIESVPKILEASRFKFFI